MVRQKPSPITDAVIRQYNYALCATCKLCHNAAVHNPGLNSKSLSLPKNQLAHA